MSQTTGFLPAGATGDGDHIGAKPFYVSMFDRLRNESESRNPSAGTRFDAAEKRGYGIQSHAGTVAAFNLRSTLDVYTQAITPAKHAAQAAVSSLLFSREANGSSQRRHQATLQLEGMETARRGRVKRGTRKGHKKGHERCPFGSSMVSPKIEQVLWNEWQGRRDSNSRPLR